MATKPVSKTTKATGWLVICTSALAISEGCLRYVYKDPLGIPTFCYGETKGAKMGDTYTQQQCDDLLVQRVIEFDKQVVQRCIGAEIIEGLPPKTRAGLVSMAYNVGPGSRNIKDGFCTLKSGKPSTLSIKLRNGDIAGACAEITKWDNPKWLRGIAIRRAEEQKMCFDGLNGK